MVRRNRETRGSSRRRKGRMIDLSEVETFVAFPELDKVQLRVKEIEEGEGDAGDYWKWVFEDADQKNGAQGTVTHITSFAKQALFNLKSLLESLGVEIPDSEFDLDEMKDEFVGMEMMAQTAQEDVETDNGRRTYTRIVDHWPLDQEDEKPGKKRGKDKEEEDRPARRGRGKDKEPAAVTEDDVNEMSQDDLETLIDEHKLDIDLGDFKTVSKMRAAVIDALKEAGVIEGEEVAEEDDRPSRGARRSGGRGKDKEEEETEEDDRPTRRSSSRRRR